MPKVQNKPFFSGIGNCYCKRVYHVRNVFSFDYAPIDQKFRNSFNQKVKFEGVNEAKQYAQQGNYAVKFDLKSGYHHIDIHPDHQKFLGFSWNFDGVQKYYVFNVLHHVRNVFSFDYAPIDQKFRNSFNYKVTIIKS
jgi:hypothetical protein